MECLSAKQLLVTLILVGLFKNLPKTGSGPILSTRGSERLQQKLCHCVGTWGFRCLSVNRKQRSGSLAAMVFDKGRCNSMGNNATESTR